jgi:hypothetical protein
MFVFKECIAPFKGLCFALGVKRNYYPVIVAQYGYGAVVEVGAEYPFASSVKRISINMKNHIF